MNQNLTQPQSAHMNAAPSFVWEGIRVTIMVPKEIVAGRISKLKKICGPNIREANFGEAFVITCPLTPGIGKTGCDIATAVIPGKLLENGILREGCRITGTLSEFGGKGGGENQIARIVCDNKGGKLKPIRLTPSVERSPCGEVAVFSMKPNEGVCVVTTTRQGSQLVSVVRELSIIWNGKYITVQARPVSTERFQSAITAACAKFQCNGGRFNPESTGCMDSHYFVFVEGNRKHGESGSTHKFQRVSGKNNGSCIHPGCFKPRNDPVHG